MTEMRQSEGLQNTNILVTQNSFDELYVYILIHLNIFKGIFPHKYKVKVLFYIVLNGSQSEIRAAWRISY